MDLLDGSPLPYLRMNAKLESIERRVKRGGGGGRSDILETLAQESFDILTLLPTYIENTKDAIADMSEESKRRYTKYGLQGALWKLESFALLSNCFSSLRLSN